MLASQLLLATLKEKPMDAELISHQLMLRAGMIRKIASGIYTWLPLGLRVLKKVEAIVREEMIRAGAQEVLMPAVQPSFLWEESQRWEQYGRELLRFKDRHDRDFCLGPTHEEVITDIARKELRSYKQLPLNLFQIQVKFRDEIRPRFGVMRAREFLMKDAYSFDVDTNSLAQSYEKMYQAYTAIFTRLNLKFRAVVADSGNIGGKISHEFQVLANSGEDIIAYSDKSDYAANLEYAEVQKPKKDTSISIAEIKKFSTPNVRTIQDLADQHQLAAHQGVKTLIVKGSQQPFIALILRGDHELNPLKAEKHSFIAAPLTFATEAEIKQAIGCGPGSLGPVNLPIPFIVDREAEVLINFTCGANEENFHFKNVNWGRDVDCVEVMDLRQAQEGDVSPDGKGHLKFMRGIEVGHIFQLGDKYSRSMNLTILDEKGASVHPQMGCYGIGITRIVAATIEQNHDDYGIIWPEPMAPFQIAIVPLSLHKSYRVREATEKIYRQLQQAGYEVLMDDRKERPGVLFATMDLLGIPHRLVISERGLDEGTIEYKNRSAQDSERWPLNQLLEKLQSTRFMQG